MNWLLNIDGSSHNIGVFCCFNIQVILVYFFWEIDTCHKGKPISVFLYCDSINGWNQITINSKFKETSLRKSNFYISSHWWHFSLDWKINGTCQPQKWNEINCWQSWKCQIGHMTSYFMLNENKNTALSLRSLLH